MFVFSKDIRNILDIRIKHSQNEIGLVFYSSIVGLAFAACSHHLLFLYFLAFLHMHLSTQHISLNFLPC